MSDKIHCPLARKNVFKSSYLQYEALAARTSQIKWLSSKATACLVQNVLFFLRTSTAAQQGETVWGNKEEMSYLKMKTLEDIHLIRLRLLKPLSF